MKKVFKIIAIILLLLAISFGVYKIFYKPNKNVVPNNVPNEIPSIIKYYSYEGNGEFVMSSTSNKVNDLKELKNNYYIKETIKREKSNGEVIEVLYNDFDSEPYLYGFYTNEEFNKYFSKEIEDGLICDDKTEIAFEEGINIKCLTHETGFEYDKINSELCAKINDKEICIKPNDWKNVDKYKEDFENAGYICEYHNFDTGKWTGDTKINNGNLECSKEKPSLDKYKDGELFCFMGTDGAAVCNDNIGWCGINNDLNTYCFGVK